MRTRIGQALVALLVALVPAGVQAATAHPRGAPSGGRIVFVGGDGNLYLVRPDGSGKTALTKDGAASAYALPTWSPTGSGILTLRFATGMQSLHPGAALSVGLWLVTPAGVARQLTTSVPRGFAWAPDGRTIVYEMGFPPADTTIVQLDTRSGRTRSLPSSGSFRLLGVTGIGNRAIGVQDGQIAAISLAKGTSQLLTSFAPQVGVWHDLVTLSPSGRTLVYALTPGNRLVSLDLRTGRSVSIAVSGTLKGAAPSPDARWVAYSTSAGALSGAESALQRMGQRPTGLRGDSYVGAQAFAPNSAALVYTSLLDGPSYVFAAPTGCPVQCARRLGLGHDASWGP